MAHGPAGHIVILVAVENRVTGSSATVTPSTIASVTSMGAPVVTATATVTPSTIASTTSMGAPSVAIGTVVTPSTISSTTSMGAPTITATALVTPATISSTTSFGALVVKIAALPATIASVTSMGAPTLTATALVTPTTITSVTSFGSLLTGKFPKTVDATGRYWKDQDGNPWFGVGEAAWSLCAQLSTTDITTYLTDRAAKGINFVLVNLVEHFYSTNHPNNINNDAPFTGTAFQSNLNNAYWLVVDHMMSKALALGITILACPAYIGFEGTEEGWDTEIAAATNTQFGTYGTNLANRYPSATFPNIVWLFGHDDVPTSTERARYDAMGANLPAAHLKVPGGVYQTGGAGGAGQGRGKLDWAGASTTFDGDTIYTYNNAGQSLPVVYMQAIWTANTGPGGFIEGHYEGESGTAQGRRDERYAVLCAGGTFAFFGNSPIWKFAAGWDTTLNSVGSVELGHTATLIAAVGKEWGPAVPDTTATFLTSGTGYARFSTKLGLVYTQVGVTVDLTEITAPTAKLRWFDPTNGTFTAVGTFSGSHAVADPGANSAGAQDWILVVEASPVALPTTIASSTSFGAPTVTTGASAAPSTIASATTMGAPVVRVDTTRAPATIASTTSMGAPVVTATATPTPTTIASATSMGASSITATATVLPGTINTTTAMGTPVVTATALVTPATIASVTSMGAPNIVTGAGTVVTPSTIAAHTTMGAPTVTATAAVSPGTIASTTTVGTPALTLGTIVTPGTIAAHTNFGAPTVSTAVVIAVGTIGSGTSFGIPPSGDTTSSTPTTIFSRTQMGAFLAGFRRHSALPAPDAGEIEVWRHSARAVLRIDETEVWRS